MTYFVTGATGFIGRHLLERLLQREGDIHVLVRPGSTGEARRDRRAARRRRAGSRPSHGDLEQPLLGARGRAVAALRGNVDHFFHLAAIYDMTADEAQRAAQRRRHAARRRPRQRARGRDLPPRLLDRRGRHLPGPLHRGHVRRGPAAAHALPPDEVRVGEARPRARAGCRGASTARRSSSATRAPARWTRSTGPYYFFKAIQKAAPARCREWFPLIGLEVGWTNIVPVDWVAAAMDHIAHEPGLDGQAFHLVNPRPQRAGDVLNTFARAGHAPQMVVRVDKRMTRHAAEGRPLLRDEAAGAAGRAARRCSPTSGSPTRCSSTWR